MKSVDTQILCIKKLTGAGIVLKAARHNLREIQAELGADSHINPAQTSKNLVLDGPNSAKAVADCADQLMRQADVPNLRKDAVRAIELLISLPLGHRTNQNGFFSDSLEWTRRHFGLPVLSAVVHNDEASPHCHVILLPLINGRMNGSAVVGNRSRLIATRDSYYETVGRRYGLAKTKAATKESRKARYRHAHSILNALQSDASLLDRTSVAGALIRLLTRDPTQILEEIKKHSNAIGFDASEAEIDQTLSCVGFHSIEDAIETTEGVGTNVSIQEVDAQSASASKFSHAVGVVVIDVGDEQEIHEFGLEGLKEIEYHLGNLSSLFSLMKNRFASGLIGDSGCASGGDRH